MFFEKKKKKLISIEGMHCDTCAIRIDKALEEYKPSETDKDKFFFMFSKYLWTQLITSAPIINIREESFNFFETSFIVLN